MTRLVALFLLSPVLALALPIEPNAVFVRVVDSGEVRDPVTTGTHVARERPCPIRSEVLRVIIIL